jgi:hypothetical protein
MISSLFCNVIRRILVVSFRRSGIIHRWGPGPRVCPESPETNYQSTLRNIPEITKISKWRFANMSTSAGYWPLIRGSLIRAKTRLMASVWSKLTLFFHPHLRLPGSRILSGIATKILKAFLVFNVRGTCSTILSSLNSHLSQSKVERR